MPPLPLVELGFPPRGGAHPDPGIFETLGHATEPVPEAGE